MPSKSKEEADSQQLDSIISRLLAAKTKPITPLIISEAEIRDLCLKSRPVFMSQPMLLKVEAPVKVCGDIHGQYTDLLRLFALAKYPPDSNFLFLGDYVDRGKQSLETICLLLAYKIKFPKNFYILRGNHECARTNRVYGFYDECKHRYTESLWVTLVKNCFNVLPVAAIIDDKIFCCHGGLSPSLHSMDQIKKLSRPTEVPDKGLLCDLLWADPGKRLKGWRNNDQRNVSYEFGADVVSEFITKHGLDLIVRAHEVVEHGYEFFANKQLVTIFSAPNYEGKYNNAAAILSVDTSLMVTFQTLKPTATGTK